MGVFTDYVQTRWADNDIYGHVNNVAYYAFFDSTINRYLIAHGLDIHSKTDAIAYIVASQCTYLKAVSYPEELRITLQVEKLGNSSVTYALKLFNAAGELCAEARMTHVYVDQATQAPTPIPAHLRAAYEKILMEGHEK